MTTTHTQDRLDDALREAFAVRDMEPETLQARLEAEARRAWRTREKRQARRRVALGLVALASVASALALASVAVPRMWAWRALRQVDASALRARTVHTVTWELGQDGRRRKVSEAWFQNSKGQARFQDGQYRFERPRLVQIFHPGRRLWTYEPPARLATWAPALNDAWPTQIEPAFDALYPVNAVVKGLASSGWRDTIASTLSKKADGSDDPRYRAFTVRPARGDSIVIISVHTDTMLPSNVQIWKPSRGARGGWRVVRQTTIDYRYLGPKTAARLFSPTFAPGVRVLRQGARPVKALARSASRGAAHRRTESRRATWR